MKKLLLSCLTALCLVGCTSTPAPVDNVDKDANELSQKPSEPDAKDPEQKEEDEKDQKDEPVAADTKKTVCTMAQTGIDVITTFEHDGTKVLKQVNTNTMTLSEVGVTKEQLEEAAKKASDSYSGITGVTYTYEFTDDDTFVETTTIDFTLAPIKDLQAAGIVQAGDADYIGIKETLELNADQGIECKDAE